MENKENSLSIEEILAYIGSRITCNFLIDFEILESKKQEIISCSGYETYKTLELLLSSQVPNQDLRTKEAPFKTYVLKNLLTGHYKIGKTSQSNVMTRINQIQVGAETKLILVIDEDIEKKLHTMFNDKLSKGEWFKLSEDDVNFIKNLSTKETL